MDKSYVVTAKIKAANTLHAVNALADHARSAQEELEQVIKEMEMALDNYGEPEEHREGVLVTQIEIEIKALKEIASKLY